MTAIHDQFVASQARGEDVNKLIGELEREVK